MPQNFGKKVDRKFLAERSTMEALTYKRPLIVTGLHDLPVLFKFKIFSSVIKLHIYMKKLQFIEMLMATCCE